MDAEAKRYNISMMVVNWIIVLATCGSCAGVGYSVFVNELHEFQEQQDRVYAKREDVTKLQQSVDDIKDTLIHMRGDIRACINKCRYTSNDD